MWSKLSKNCIIEGPVTSFCLVCERLVRNVDEVDKHIEDPDHGHRLELYPYLEKYSRDCIRKIKGLYLCECCSVTLKTATTVKAHICTREHVNNRGRQQLRAGPDDGVIAFDEMLITGDAWHATENNCCSLCDEEGDSEHKHSTSHLLKLVQSTIEFVENGFYRKIDEDTVQCLSCNVIFEMNSIKNHFDSEDHKVTFTKSKVQEDEKGGEIKTENTGNLESSKEDIEKAKDDEKNVVLEIEKVKKISEDNKITYNTGYDSAYCRVCDVRMSSTLRVMKEHVTDTNHVNKLKPKLVTSPVAGFLKKTIVINNDSFQDAVINYKFCISFWTFFMMFINSEENLVQCHVCEQKIDDTSPLVAHIKTFDHVKAMKKIKIVTTFHDEFLREIRPGVVHCGVCNILVPKWDDILNHLESVDHKAEKIRWQVRLMIHLPDLLVENGLACSVDENTIRCLICNIQLDILSINNHFDSEDHRAAFNKNEVQEDKINGEIKTENAIANNKESPKQNTDKANVDKKKSVVSEIEEIKMLSEDNEITYNTGHDSAYCRVCDVRMSSTLRAMKEHVTDTNHVNKLKPKLITTRSERYFISTISIANEYFHDELINYKFYISLWSFFMIFITSDNILRCHVCNQTITDIIQHITTPQHKKAIKKTKVVTTFHDEFLREIRPGVVHCGFCNILVPKWDDILNHLESVDHKAEKSHWQFRLMIHLPVVLVATGLACEVDENTIRCLICHIQLKKSSINNHYDSEDHKAAIIKSKVQENKMNHKIKTENVISKNIEYPKPNTDKAIDDEKDANNSSHDSVYCSVCDVAMPSTQRSKHITDVKHVNKLKSNKPKLITEPFKQFAKHRIMLGDTLTPSLPKLKNSSCYFIINKKIAIPIMNYEVIGKPAKGLRCHICKQNFSEGLYMDVHVGLGSSTHHREAIENALVVTSIDNEFLREIHPSTFHCGFCNVIITKWDEVPNHLASADHKFKKAACQDRLKELLDVYRQANN